MELCKQPRRYVMTDLGRIVVSMGRRQENVTVHRDVHLSVRIVAMASCRHDTKKIVMMETLTIPIFATLLAKRSFPYRREVGGPHKLEVPQIFPAGLRGKFFRKERQR
jgi:hypothetical protein